MLRVLSFVLACALAGCGAETLPSHPGSSGGAGGGSGGAGGGSGGAGGGTGGAGGQYTLVETLTIGPFTLPPGQETTQCITKRMTTTTDTDVTRIETALLPGSHHLIFYKSSATNEQPNPAFCTAFDSILTAGAAPLLIAESPSAFLNFPDGVAYSMPAGQMVRIEAHYINTTQSTITAMGTVRLYTNTQTGTIHDHANLMFYGNSLITLPPDSQPHTVGPTFHAINDGRKIFGLTTHTHRLGVDANIDLATNWLTPVMRLYDNPNWDNPPLLLLDPPLAIPSGQGLRFTCTYVNDTSGQVNFGESANDEMCFMWAYYYPDHGFDACLTGTPLGC